MACNHNNPHGNIGVLGVLCCFLSLSPSLVAAAVFSSVVVVFVMLFQVVLHAVSHVVCC